jgi:phosphoglycolate phosphatase
MPDPDVVVFDLDHTLVNSPLDLVAAALEMEAVFASRGHPLPARPERWYIAEQLELARSDYPHLLAELLNIPARHELAAMEHAHLEPHAIETLAAVREAGFATALWTNNNRVVTEFVVARLELAALFDLVVTRDDVGRMKPEPDGLHLIRARWPAAHRTVVVGDAWIEGAAAAAVGVPFVAYQARPEEMAARDISPAAYIESLDQLLPALQVVFEGTRVTGGREP